MIEKEFVPYEEAFALKELGFNEPCLGYYLCRNSAFGIDDLEITTECIDLVRYDYASCVVPTFSQAFRWFREKYGLYSCIMYSSDGIIKGGYSPMIDVMKPHKATLDLNTYDIYEEAELECLKKLIEIVKTV
jgi:hypothetical protein